MKEVVLNENKPLASQQPKKVVFIEMFKAGPQISSTGQKMVFSEEDLEQVVNSYDPVHHEAPLIIGHDQEDGTPSLGWVQKVWRKGAELWGKVELTPKAEKLIKEGVFKKVSSSFYLPDASTNPTPGKLSLRHLGLVSIPAVKGLAAFTETDADLQTITITPSEGESSISFKENLETTLTMARKKTQKEAPVTSVVDHADGGGMTVNINIGPGSSAGEGGGVYDDGGNKVSESGAPADYDMDYSVPEGEEGDEGVMDPEAPTDDLGLDGESEGEGEGEMPSDTNPLAEEAPEGDPEAELGGVDEEQPQAEEPGVESEDVSDELGGSEEKIAHLAADYEIEDLIKALALKTDAASMTEDSSMESSSYSEKPKEEEEEEKDEEGETADHSCETKDMGEDVSKGEEPSGAEEPKGEDVKEGEEPKGEEVYSEEEASDDDDDEKEKDEEGKEEATGTLEHSESAIGVQESEGASLQSRVAELEEELAKQKRLMREKEIGDFAETLYEKAQLTEAIAPKADLIRFMETLNSKNTVNFSETGKASQFDFFKQVLNNLPSMVSFEEVATPASAPAKSKQPTPSADGYVYDPASTDLHVKALEYSEAKGVAYETALKAIILDS